MLILFADNKPVVIVSGLEKREFNKTDKEFTLRCKAKGVPPPLFSWYKDGERIGTQVSTHHLPNGVTVSELKRTRINMDDNGRYECLASNSAGEANSSAIVTIQGKIQMTINFQPQDSFGRFVKILS